MNKDTFLRFGGTITSKPTWKWTPDDSITFGAALHHKGENRELVFVRLSFFF